MNLSNSPPTAFQIDGGVPAQFLAILLPWHSPPPGSVAFDTQVVGRSTNESVWRAVLPADDASACQELVHAERELEEVLVALPVAERRLPAAVVPDAFAHTDHSRTPEADLRAALAGITVQSGASGVAFATGDRASIAWEKANSAFDTALNLLQRLVGGRSWVETFASDVLLARTLLGRAGNQFTAWREGITVAEAGLHTRALALAQSSRTALARTITLAVRGATLLTSLMSGPAGMLLALPAVWKFIDDVVAEVAAGRTRREESTRG